MIVQYIILSYTVKAVLGDKFIDAEAHIRKLETIQINNLTMYSKFQENKKSTSNPEDGKKQFKKIRQLMTQKLKEHTKSKSQFFEKVNNTDKPLAKVTKERRQRSALRLFITNLQPILYHSEKNKYIPLKRGRR